MISNNIECSLDIRDEAKRLGYHVFYHENEKDPLSYDELGCDVLVQHTTLKFNNLKDFRNLKYVCTAMVGTDMQPIDELKKRRILYTNARGVYDSPIAEFVIMRILEIYKHTREFDIQKNKHVWQQRHDLCELTGRNAAIIGTGGIGKEIAKRLSPFGVDCIGFSKSGRLKEGFKDCIAIDNLKNEINNFDIIVLCVPLQKNTYHLFDKEMFKYVKSNAVLVNVGRGALVEENSLCDVLSSKRLLGAAIDVFEKEPLDYESCLWNLENFWYSPHNSFNSNATEKRMYDMIISNLKAFIEGRQLNNLL